MKGYNQNSRSVEPVDRKLVLLSISLYIISLFLPCFYTNIGVTSSLVALMFGMFGVLFGGAGFSWLANPALIMAWASAGAKKNYCLFYSLCATFFALIFLSFDKIPLDEGGGLKDITSLGIGYYLWTSSMLVMLIGSLLRKRVILGEAESDISNHE